MDRFITILREETDLNVREIEQLVDSSCNRAFALSEIYGDALARLKEFIVYRFDDVCGFILNQQNVA